MDNNNHQDTLKEIRHQFLVYRNGMVADALKKAGYPYNLIYGLQLPQLNLIAKNLVSDYSLAMSLWQQKDVRESRLLSFFLFPKEEMTLDIALSLINSLQTPEEADILNFKLLRFLPFAAELAAIPDNQNNNPFFAYCLNQLRHFLAQQ